MVRQSRTAVRKLLPRRARAHDLARGDILEAAARVFGHAGFEATTMRDIAHEAGLTAASLYTYFPGKQAIFQGLVELHHREVLGTFGEPLPAGLTFAQKLELLFRRQLAYAERRREAFRMFLSSESARRAMGAGRGPGSAAGHKIFIEHLTRWIKAHATPEDLGGFRPDEVAYFLAGIGYSFGMRAMQGHAPAPGRLEDRVHRVIGLLLYGLAGRTHTSPAGAG